MALQLSSILAGIGINLPHIPAIPAVPNLPAFPSIPDIGAANHRTSTKLTTSTTLSTLSTAIKPTTTSTSAAAATSSTGTTSAATTSAATTSSGLSTSSSTSSSAVSTSSSAANVTAVGGQTVRSTILILAKSAADASQASSGLDGYGIPYEVLLVPVGGIALPILNTSATQGNYGGFIMLSELSYAVNGSYASGLTDLQFNSIYAYQKAFGVRMVRLDTYPYPSAFGAQVIGNLQGCCDSAEQLVSFSNTTGFAGANVKTGAGMSTKGLWHYAATITDPTTTWEIASFAADSGGNVNGSSTAAIINDFGGRQQMVFFMSWATNWSPTSNYLQHAYIHWMTRGLFVGARKTYLGAQIDDVHLQTGMYTPQGNVYRTIPKDFQMHADWQTSLNSRLPAGSKFFIELGHNGNGDIIAATNLSDTACDPDSAVFYDSPPDTLLEFQKPLGTGFTVWPTTPKSYVWTVGCAAVDDLAKWFMTPANRDNFGHVSHTFTHLHENNVSYSDIVHEIVFNQAWLDQVGISSGAQFSPNGLIPPAITGLHNGDALRAWMDNKIKYAVGDNSRPVLLNTQSNFWPYITTLAANGYDGVTVVPRWPTNIFWDCDLPACTTQEWTDLFKGTGQFADLLTFERTTTSRYLLGLRQDPYMFHQANLRVNDVAPYTVGSSTGQMSLVMIWVETVTQELARLTNWPVVTLKHDDIAKKFIERMARDNCKPSLTYTYSKDGMSITAVTVSASGNSCSAPIPVTLPGPATGGSATDDKLGSEPLIKWVTLSGSPQTFTLATPVSVLA